MRGRPPDGIYRRECSACGCEVTSTRAAFKLVEFVLCDKCKGVGWNVLFDRASGVGTIPPNLVARLKEPVHKVPRALEGRMEHNEKMRRLLIGG